MEFCKFKIIMFSFVFLAKGSAERPSNYHQSSVKQKKVCTFLKYFFFMYIINIKSFFSES